MPREPSTPRIAIWRRLKQLGVVQISDGLVALPDDVRTREQLEWVADQAIEAGGEATIWVARTTRAADDDALARQLNDARNDEYAGLLADIRGSGAGADARTIARWRREYRRIERRDHLRAPGREAVRLALAELPQPDRAEETSR